MTGGTTVPNFHDRRSAVEAASLRTKHDFEWRDIFIPCANKRTEDTLYLHAILFDFSRSTHHFIYAFIVSTIFWSSRLLISTYFATVFHFHGFRTVSKVSFGVVHAMSPNFRCRLFVSKNLSLEVVLLKREVIFIETTSTQMRNRCSHIYLEFPN